MKKIFLLMLLMSILIKTYSQCNNTLPACTTTINTSSSTALTINSGEVYCITNGYTGSITVNSGGTLLLSGNGALYSSVTIINNGNTILSNINLNTSNLTNNATLNIRSDATLSNIKTGSIGTINNCGNITTNNFNKNTILNNYADNITIPIKLDEGSNINNYGNNVTYNVTGNPNNSFTFTNATNKSATIVTPPTSLNSCGTSLGNATFITNNGILNFPNSVCIVSGSITNNKTMNFNSQLYMDGGSFTNNGTSYINNIYKNNGSLNIGDFSNTEINTIGAINNGGFVMSVSGCSYISVNVPPSYSFNTNLLNSGSNVAPNGINYCGGVPMNGSASGNTISNITNNGSGGYRITLTNSTNAPNNGDAVAITGVSGTKINGYWKVVKISSTEYDLVGSVYYPITSLTGNYIYTNNIRFGSGNHVDTQNCSGKTPCVSLGFNNTDTNPNPNYPTNIDDICYKNIIIYDILGRVIYKNDFILCDEIKNIVYNINGTYIIVYITPTTILVEKNIVIK